ncbi:hypothetical protein SNE40_020012 [Patella caerulea]|uniref:Uncharacterized protein n=1 Tax=Patella caerulea TaxID=87958 RepID=A0AAN8IY45_PATCE
MEENQDLICISCGVVASNEVKSDILTAKERGTIVAKAFIRDRLINKNDDIFSPIQSMKIKTFSTLLKLKQQKHSTGKDINLKNDRNLFPRLLVIGQNRELDLKDILTYSLGPVSFPLSSSDGSLAKTDKSPMTKILESSVDNCLVDKSSLGGNTCLLIDAIALIQSMSNIPDTFGELSDVVFHQLVI